MFMRLRPPALERPGGVESPTGPADLRLTARRRCRRHFAEVRLAHPRVAHDLVGRAFRDERPEVEHVDALHEVEHHVGVVLDEEHRGAALLVHDAEGLGSARVSTRSRPDDGSSSSSRRGSVISARPTSTNRPCPRLSASIGRAASRVRPSSSSVESMRAFSSPLGLPIPSRSFHSAVRWPRERSATSRCSRTVMPANSSMRWNVRAMPSLARLCCGSRPIETPPNRTVPSSGRSVPDKQLNSVVLPAPLGPIRPTTSPSPTRGSRRRAR